MTTMNSYALESIIIFKIYNLQVSLFSSTSFMYSVFFSANSNVDCLFVQAYI